MCGIFLKSNFYTDTDLGLFIKSANTLNHRGPDEEGFLFTNNFCLGHKRLSIIDKENGKQPMSILNNHLIYNGELYNTNKLRDKLKKDNINLTSHSDTEVLLQMLIKYKELTLDDLNGIFAFAFCNNHKVLAARDPVGVKPLYYKIVDNDIIIASEIKAILKYCKSAVVDRVGLTELLALGPAHSPGMTVYKDIYELKPGHYLTFDKTSGLVIKQYFNVSAKEYNNSLEDTLSYVKYLVSDSCRGQTISDVTLACLLSGGLDSSVVSSYVSQMKDNLETYSISYEGNKEDYVSNNFEVSDDNDYIGYVTSYLDVDHNNITIDLKTMIDYLKVCVCLKDYPGMTDIDCSMYYLAKNIKKKHSVALSGECADEIFGGYPWFYKDIKYEAFPWIRNLDFRQNIINPDLNIDIKDYVTKKYDEIIKEAPILNTDSEEKIKERQMSYINLKYFMTTLLERKDRMTMGASLEVRVPFADKRLVDFLYNVDFKHKYYNNVEKALLRDACKDILPIEVYNRKKSPYPKSRNKNYNKIVSKMLLEVLKEKDNMLHQIFDSEKLIDLINQEEELEVPWYGQLMRKDQLLAYILQIDFWLKEYNIILQLDE